MLMGLTNALATFMQIMKKLFVDMLDKEVVVFLNDILIYSTIVKKHFELPQRVFACFYKHTF